MGKSSGVGLLVCLQVWRTSCVLQCVAVRCSVLQCGALWCSVVQWVVACCGVLQCAAVCCSVLQCVALCCSVLQCDAICCSVLQYVANISNVERSCCSLFFCQKEKKETCALVCCRRSCSFVNRSCACCSNSCVCKFMNMYIWCILYL